MVELEQQIKEQAHALGFELVGIAPATVADGFDRLRSWLERDYAGEMAYMQRYADARRHPSSVLPEVRSIVMVGMNYLASRERPSSPLSPAGRGEKEKLRPRQEELHVTPRGMPIIMTCYTSG